MTLETRAAVTALITGLLVVGICYGLSAVIAPHLSERKTHGQAVSNLSPASPQLVATGQGYYAQSCASCHGATGQGTIGPSLHALGESDTQIGGVIRDGVKGSMPAFGNKYNTTQQQALVAYVQSLK